MKASTPAADVSAELVEAIRSFPLERVVEHCGHKWTVSPFDFYAACPHCSERLKLRSFSGVSELEDVFDAVFEWMTRAGAAELAKRRQEEIGADLEDS
jgi:hypothetical protein